MRSAEDMIFLRHDILPKTNANTTRIMKTGGTSAKEAQGTIAYIDKKAFGDLKTAGECGTCCLRVCL